MHPHRRARSSRRTLLAVCSAAPLALLSLGVAMPASADTEDFSYDSWHGRYEIGVDDEGRAVVEVTETLVARFPDIDQNRGVVRALPLRYEGAPAAPESISVVDDRGEPVAFDVDDEDGFRAVLTGDDAYVHGVQTYVVSYTLHDVVATVDDGSVDEFSWDLVPLERAQDIERFSAELVFADDALENALTGSAACYTGPAESTERCDLQTRTDDEGTVFAVGPLPMPALSGVTVAVGIETGTVVQPPERLPSFALDGLPIILSGLAATAGGIGGSLAIAMRRRRRRATGVVVAQYDVPADLPPLVAGPIAGAPGPALPAEFVHLAVTGVMRIEEERADADASSPSFRLVDPALVGDPLDARTVSELFGDASPGALFTPPDEDEGFAARMTKLTSEGVAQAGERGYLEKVRSRAGTILGIAALALVVTVVVLLMAGAGRDNPATLSIGITGVVLAVVAAVTGLVRHRVHTRSGAEAREHLAGVREFIRVAEADRLRVLQSYEGAERTPDGAVDVVRLYERLLPYAMLFGFEKQWADVLATRYRESDVAAPLWYPALLAHGAGGLGSTLSQFTGSLSSSVSYTSSSAGGSTGGGFSGSGGGGGFSGGR
ncbi:DUF2207 domain-containing protein [Microbacterium betulae]|uniref:DUF2207 domain-containing protein n=1 Tax=Microbacterium betulae TaxID=2981139 RepID=A0AA97I8B1_9MICO|nr:DUF2207 domain-containing protein [Microbacterium sp. AB]WOF24482.1 DUF2207 domain-containing protein [Microbacterium sp. AB]